MSGKQHHKDCLLCFKNAEELSPESVVTTSRSLSILNILKWLQLWELLELLEKKNLYRKTGKYLHFSSHWPLDRKYLEYTWKQHRKQSQTYFSSNVRVCHLLKLKGSPSHADHMPFSPAPTSGTLFGYHVLKNLAVHCCQVCHPYNLLKLCRHRATEQGNKHKLPSVAKALITAEALETG